MKARTFGIIMLVTVPLFVGGLVGYNVGHSVADPGTVVNGPVSNPLFVAAGETVGQIDQVPALLTELTQLLHQGQVRALFNQ